jgi:hypothetical protein
MRHFLSVVVSVAVVALLLHSCNETPTEDLIDGRWSAIELNQEEFEFSSRGGSAIIKCTNYPKLWLSSLVLANDCDNPEAYIHPERNEKYETLSIKAEGITVTRVDKVSYTISVDPSDKAIHWILGVSAGDAGKNVSIYQNTQK